MRLPRPYRVSVGASGVSPRQQEADRMSESAGPGGEKLDLFSLSNLPADWVPERDSQCVRFVRPFIAWLPNP